MAALGFTDSSDGSYKSALASLVKETEFKPAGEFAKFAPTQRYSSLAWSRRVTWCKKPSRWERKGT